MSLVRARVIIHTKAPVNGKVSILLFMFCCCFKERTRSRRRDEKNNSGHDSSSLSLSLSLSVSFGVCRLYIYYICYSHVVMLLYTQIRAMASERGSRNVIISKTVDATCVCVWVTRRRLFRLSSIRILYYIIIKF